MFNGVVCGGVRWSGLMQPLAVHVKNKSCPEIELKLKRIPQSKYSNSIFQDLADFMVTFRI